MRSRTRTAVTAPVALVALGVAALTVGPLYRVRTWWTFDDPLADDPAVVAVQAVLGVAGLLVVVRHRRDGRFRRGPLLLAGLLAGWLLLGTSWSADPVRTAREVLLVAAALAAGMAAALLLQSRALIWSSWLGTHAGLAWSAVAIAASAPGSQDQRGDWTGVYFNRNSLALTAAIGLLLSILLLAEYVRRPGRAEHVLGWARLGTLAAVALLGACLVDAALLAGSESLTPVFATAAALTAVVLFTLLGRLDRHRWLSRHAAGVVGLVAVGAVAAAWARRGQLGSLAGRDAGFSGRDDIWAVAWEWFRRRPVQGWGYLGAWGDPAFVAEVVARRGETLSSAHSSFVEVLLGGGVVAAALLLAVVVWLYATVAEEALEDGLPGRWPLALFVFVVVEQLSETLLVGGQLVVAIAGALLVTWQHEPAGRTVAAGSRRAPAVDGGSARGGGRGPGSAPAAPARR